MRLFVILRIVFFLILLAASSIFLLHSQLCINYVPHQLDTFLKNCQDSVDAIVSIDRKLGKTPESSNRTARSISEGDVVFINETEQSGMSNDDGDGLLESITMIDKWHRLDSTEEIITLNAKTCFDFVINSSNPKYKPIFRPIYLILLLTFISFMTAILDMAMRYFLQKNLFIQNLAHTIVQVGIWASNLVIVEIYRRSWTSNWLELGQSPTEIPMYPMEFERFEIYALILMLFSTLDVFLYEHLAKKLKLVNSQGVYKCIDQEST